MTVRTLKLKTHLCKPMGMLASKCRQSIASVDLLLQIFDIVLTLWACSFFGERGGGERRNRDRGILLWLRLRGANTARPHPSVSLSHKAQESRILHCKLRTTVLPEHGFDKSLYDQRAGRGNI